VTVIIHVTFGHDQIRLGGGSKIEGMQLSLRRGVFSISTSVLSGNRTIPLID
jgi:hypothetical protein